MKAKIAVYPGTFDPITNGHLDVIRRSAKLFDKIILAVANDNYKSTVFSTQERLDLARECIKDLDNVVLDTFNGLLADYLNEKQATAIIRGLRAISDFEYEMQMASINKNLNEDLETVFLMTDAEYSFISSSMIKKVACLGGDVSKFVPKHVCKAMQAKYQGRNMGDE